MIINSKSAEEKALIDAAHAMCAAARTAPKARGIDKLDTAIVTGEDKDRLAAEMRRLAEVNPEIKIYTRDAANVDNSALVVLFGARKDTYGIGKGCGLCQFEDCAENKKADGLCIFPILDLGIAIGSAVSTAMDFKVDSRVMFSVGKAAASLKILGDHAIVFGVPLSVTGKSPFFDR